VPASDPRELLQHTLGSRYLLERELGRGGMATVFLARDTKHDRPVALKLLHADLAAALGPERFRREIALAARLQHPHILSVHDSGEGAPGQLWFTMPYVAGETLRARLQRERQLPTHDAVRIAREVALALDYAHQQGVVHRDIKPENILLTADGQALVADFGIARALASNPDTSLTEVGMALGTAQYMSPEQAAGERTVDGRSDVYALGVVLYEMLVGEPPFTGPTTQAIIAKIMSAPVPSVREARPSVPVAVDAAIHRALDRVPAERFATAGEFARALDVAERAPTTAAPPQRRVPVAALALALGVFLGGGMLFAWRSSHGAAATAPEGVRLAVLPFDNIGDSADAYFADGLTDAVRTKLTALPGVDVIASNSSAQYRHTDKSPKQIGQELGVRYLLVGKVRWAKTPGSPGRILVAPELIDATTATDKWSASFDTTLTDVFAVQGAIASQAATQLGVALGNTQRVTLDSAPTHNVAAYEAYLQGTALLPHTFGFDQVAKRQAVADFRQAVVLDPAFALAWARLGLVESRLAWGQPTSGDGIQSRTDIDHALALNPNLPQAHHALGAYYGNVLHDDHRSSTEDSIALAHAPHDLEAIGSLAQSDMGLGRPVDAVRMLEQAKPLDPRSVSLANRLVGALLAMGRSQDAHTEAERGLALDPTNSQLLVDNAIALGYLGDDDGALAQANRLLALDPSSTPGTTVRIMIHARQGDLAAAQAALNAPPPGTDLTALAVLVAQNADWILDHPAADRVLAASTKVAAQFNDIPTDVALIRTGIYYRRGDAARVRLEADSARRLAVAALADGPVLSEMMNLAIADAYLGHRDDALREAAQAVAAVQPGAPHPAFTAQYNLAYIRLVLGDRDAAADALVIALHMPGNFMTLPSVRINPDWAPLRSVPAFQRLLNEGKPVA
jgi:TolB-like protein/Tfp pilus assembly protein PilF